MIACARGGRGWLASGSRFSGKAVRTMRTKKAGPPQLSALAGLRSPLERIEQADQALYVGIIGRVVEGREVGIMALCELHAAPRRWIVGAAVSSSSSSR